MPLARLDVADVKFSGLGSRGSLVWPRAAGLRLPLPRGAFRFSVATADIAHGVHGCAAEEREWTNSGAHAREEFLRRDMARHDRYPLGRGLPGDCARSDRFLQI